MTPHEIAHSLRQIAAHARPGLIVGGKQRMVIELSAERLAHLIAAADIIDDGDDAPDTDGMGL